MSSISIIGLGDMARAIGARAVEGGNAVEVIGRDAAKAKDLAAALGGGATAGTFGTAPAGDIVILAVPYASAVPVVAQYGDALAGKVIIDISNTFNADATELVTPDGTSGAQEIAKAVPASAHVVKAFNTVFGHVLALGRPLDVLFAGDDARGQGERVGVHREPRAAPAGRRQPGDGALAGGGGPADDGPGRPRRRVQHRPRRRRLRLSAPAPAVPAPRIRDVRRPAPSAPRNRRANSGFVQRVGTCWSERREVKA